MNITRDNYEEFLILYMDNELSVADRRQVESFLDAHPDLRAELDLLEQTKLVPDEQITFTGKDSLLGFAAGPISTGNFETWLLSYIDNELSAAERRDVESFVARHVPAQQQLALLQKTKLQADTSIIFADKESLYRHEERARVTPWKRLAIAASLLIAVSTTAVLLYQNTNTTTGNSGEMSAVSDDSKKSNTPKAISPGTGTADNTDNTNTTDGVKEIETPLAVDPVRPGQDNGQLAVNTEKSDDIKTSVENKSGVVNAVKADEPVSSRKNGNDLPLPTHNPNVNESISDADNRIKMDPPTREGLTVTKQIYQLPLVTPADPQPSLIRHLTTDTDVEEDIAAAPARKNKLRGFFRKVTRTFEKNTNIKATDEEDRLLIGGLAIRL